MTADHYQMPRLTDLQVGRLNYVTAYYQGERFYVLSLVGVDWQDAECRPVSLGFHGLPTKVMACADLKRHSCQSVENSEAGKIVKLIWEKLRDRH